MFKHQKIDRKCFVRDRLLVYKSNTADGIENSFTLDDIRGAGATLLIAGNDTVRLYP